MQTPRRVVSLSPNMSMMLFALGADAVVVGRTQDCIQAIQQYLRVWRIPEAHVAQRLQHWQDLPVVGAWPLADHQAVRSLHPDGVLTSGSGACGVHEAETLGIEAAALHHFDTRTLRDLEQHLRQLGALLGKTAEAARVSTRLAQRCEAAQARRHAWAVPPTVLFEYCVCTQYDADPARRSADPARIILVGGHLAPDLIQLSGGTPLFTRPGDTAQWVTSDAIRAARPEVILQYDCHGCPVARQHPVPARRDWSALPAVASAAVYPLYENISDPNLCFPAALEHLIGVMHQHAVPRAPLG